MKVFQIWSEGFLATGMEGVPSKPYYHGSALGVSFQEACDKHFASDSEGHYYDPKTLRYYGCKLFDKNPDCEEV